MWMSMKTVRMTRREWNELLARNKLLLFLYLRFMVDGKLCGRNLSLRVKSGSTWQWKNMPLIYFMIQSESHRVKEAHVLPLSLSAKNGFPSSIHSFKQTNHIPWWWHLVSLLEIMITDVDLVCRGNVLGKLTPHKSIHQVIVAGSENSNYKWWIQSY